MKMLIRCIAIRTFLIGNVNVI